VEDEEELVILYKHFIEATGLDAVSFTNPLLVLEHFKTNKDKFSLVITNLRTPGMCGLELTNKIKELNDSVKIFLITAFDTADLENNSSCQYAIIDKALQKPINFLI